MHSFSRTAAAATLALLLVSCGHADNSDDLTPNEAAEINVDAIDSAADAGVDNIAPPMEAPTPGSPGGLANDMTPVSEAPFAPESAQGAADVVQRYFALIEARKFGEAWTLWEDGGKASGNSVEQFAADFGAFSEYHANVGAPGEVEAGAGQRYVSVPVVVYGKRKSNGQRFDAKGDVTLHLTVVDGASEAQKHWHISSMNLVPNP